MIVLPATSTTIAPAGTGVDARGPTATIRSSRTITTPSATIPPSSLAIVTSLAPTSATVPRCLAAAVSIDSDTPDRGGTNAGAFLGRGASANRPARSAV